MAQEPNAEDFLDMVMAHLARVPEESEEAEKLHEILNAGLDDPEAMEKMYVTLVAHEADLVERDEEDRIQAAKKAFKLDNSNDAKEPTTMSPDNDMERKIRAAIRVSLLSEPAGDGGEGEGNDGIDKILEGEDNECANRSQEADDIYESLFGTQADPLYDELVALSDRIEQKSAPLSEARRHLIETMSAVTGDQAQLEEQVEFVRAIAASLDDDDAPSDQKGAGDAKPKETKPGADAQQMRLLPPPPEPPYVRRLTLLLRPAAPAALTATSEVRTLAHNLRTFLLTLSPSAAGTAANVHDRLIDLATLVIEILEFAGALPVDTINPANDSERTYRHRFFTAWEVVQAAMTSYFANREPEEGEPEGFEAIVDVFNGAVDAMTEENDLAGAFAQWREDNRRAAEESMAAEEEKEAEQRSRRKRRRGQ